MVGRFALHESPLRLLLLVQPPILLKTAYVRRRGITEIRGPYYSVMGKRYLSDVLDTAGHWIDSLKVYQFFRNETVINTKYTTQMTHHARLEKSLLNSVCGRFLHPSPGTL